MNTKEAYNNWAETYDSIVNPTRNLDEKVVRTELIDIKDKDIVEAGCGTGKNSVYFAEYAKSLRAFDISDEMLSVAKTKVKNRSVEFLIHDITKPWPFDNQICDLVSINLILEHIENINFVFQEAFRILRKKGGLFVCELHPLKQEKGSVARFNDKEQNEVRLISFYHSKDDFENALKSAGFKNIIMKDWFDETNKDIPRLLSVLTER